MIDSCGTINIVCCRCGVTGTNRLAQATTTAANIPSPQSASLHTLLLAPVVVAICVSYIHRV